jgi:hypothetical protein
MIMIYAGLIILGIVIGYYMPKIKSLSKSNGLVNVSAPIRHKDHLKPRYYGYGGNYANVNKCSKCDLHGLYEDLHETDPCPRCGGKVVRTESAKYGKHGGVYMWIPSNWS